MEEETGAATETRSSPSHGPGETSATVQLPSETDTNEQSKVDTAEHHLEAVSEQKLPAKSTKVALLLKAVGDAPIMKQKMWMVEQDKTVTWVVKFIKRFLKLPPADSVFVYVSQAFSPSPDQTIENLLACFGTEDKLVLHYCRTQAWG